MKKIALKFSKESKFQFTFNNNEKIEIKPIHILKKSKNKIKTRVIVLMEEGMYYFKVKKK